MKYSLIVFSLCFFSYCFGQDTIALIILKNDKEISLNDLYYIKICQNNKFQEIEKIEIEKIIKPQLLNQFFFIYLCYKKRMYVIPIDNYKDFLFENKWVIEIIDKKFFPRRRVFSYCIKTGYGIAGISYCYPFKPY